MVEKEKKTAEDEKKKEKSVEKDQKKEKEKDTLPIETDQTAEKDKAFELNADDEFEEFPIYEASLNADLPVDEPKDLNVWEDNWEDETVEEDFALRLSKETGNKEILKFHV
ncbi:hypothetical protein M3Y97_00947000 [Aphelenchoides bicaudatus]|nr:hypothetical protein M3Y97_00947000 [Aphelenchoides bicaudatus]